MRHVKDAAQRIRQRMNRGDRRVRKRLSRERREESIPFVDDSSTMPSMPRKEGS
jgi:hypothetical protein